MSKRVFKGTYRWSSPELTSQGGVVGSIMARLKKKKKKMSQMTMKLDRRKETIQKAPHHLQSLTSGASDVSRKAISFTSAGTG